MKPAAFEYYAPASVEEAVGRLAAHGWDAKVLAGGQSLIPMMNFRLAQPSVIVDLNRVGELFYVRPGPDGGVRLGAMTRQSTVEHHPLILERAPLVHAAMPKVAYPAIRNRGTFGGSIAHADPSAELVAASVASRASFRCLSQRGERWVPAEDFYVGLLTTVLEVDELLVEIALPAMPPRCGWAFVEVARRHHDFALVGAAAEVTLDESDRCDAARLVFFSVSDRPVEAHGAAGVLIGHKPTAEAIQAAAAIAGAADVDPIADIHATSDFRRHLVKVLGRRALAEAFGRALAWRKDE